jgi:hypothetical protein
VASSGDRHAQVNHAEQAQPRRIVPADPRPPAPQPASSPYAAAISCEEAQRLYVGDWGQPSGESCHSSWRP